MLIVKHSTTHSNGEGSTINLALSISYLYLKKINFFLFKIYIIYLPHKQNPILLSY